jgi:hypothetical protein
MNDNSNDDQAEEYGLESHHNEELVHEVPAVSKVSYNEKQKQKMKERRMAAKILKDQIDPVPAGRIRRFGG